MRFGSKGNRTSDEHTALRGARILKMLEVAVSVVDRLIQLATVRERNKEKYFNNFIEPLYKDAEQVVKDYLGLFTELAHRLETADDIEPVINWLEERRVAYQPLRMKMRALLRKEPRYATDDPREKFNKGIWGLMRGGVSLLEQGHGQTREYGFGGHTVLDIMIRLRDEALRKNRNRFIETTRAQQSALERAWQDVVAGYVDIKHRSLST
jgi:hypothetical protein